MTKLNSPSLMRVSGLPGQDDTARGIPQFARGEPGRPRRHQGMRLCFLFNHDQIHQIAHSLPIALALAESYLWTGISRVALFWAAFILTRPLGATVGDFLDKPLDKGGLDLSRPVASAVLAVAIVLLIALLPQRAERHPASSSR